MPRTTKTYNLQSINPHLVKEWHPIKNGSLKPSDFAPSSHKKVWWICKKSHEWQARISHRNNGIGCPFCSGKKVHEDNCLQNVNPKLSKEWHPIKNKKLSAKDVSPGSHKKVWWICKKGHEWQAQIRSRFSGVGCPYCYSHTSQLELRIFTELKFLFENAKHRKKVFGVECDVFLPDLKVGIEVDGFYWHKKRYKNDIEKTKILSNNGISLIRVREKGLKKISQSDIIFTEKTDNFKLLTDLLYELSKQNKITDALKAKIHWYLKNGKIANDKEYVKHIDRLPSPQPGFSLWDNNRKLCNEWHPSKNAGLAPQDVSPNSHKIVWWFCKNGHEWRASIANRNKGRGCPYCAGQKVCVDNCLNTINFHVAKEWHPTKNGKLTAKDVLPGSNRKAWWICKNGHEWQASIAKRNGGHGCPYCSGKVVFEDNCLKSLNPSLSAEWHQTKNEPLLPEDVTPGSNRKVWWVCNKGHEWIATISNRSSGTGCPYCAGKAVCDDNCLKTLNPSLAVEWHPDKNGKLRADDVRPNSHKKVWWKCKNSHEWQALISHRNKGVGCPYCKGKLATRSYNLEVINPILAKQWHPLKNGKVLPTDVTPNSHKKVWWQCTNGHEWYAQIASRNRGNNCPYCSGRRKKLINL